MQNRVVEGLEFRVLSALRVPDRPFSRREADLFTCFLRYRARLPRPHPPREGLPDGLHDGWYGRRKNRNKYAKPAKRRHVCPLITATVSKYKVKCSDVLSDGGEKYGLAEWRHARRRALLSLRTQREGPPRAKEEGVLDAGRIRSVSENSQTFYVYGGIMRRDVVFVFPERATY